MAKSDELFGVDGEIRLKLLGHVINSGIVEKFHKTCDDICLALKLWDGAFSDIHTPNPSVEHCNQLGTELTRRWHTFDQWGLVSHQKYEVTQM
jgi:hypothetical protein